MGNIEEKIKKEIRIGKIEKVILGVVCGAGVLSMALLAPNALQILRKTKFLRQKKNYLNKTTRRLQEKGFIKFEKNDNKIFLKPTKKGQNYFLTNLNSPENLKKKKWDKKWRMVIFDIPESKKHLRNKVRDTLESLGLKKLQNSVWVFPYPIEDLVVILKANLEIGKDVLYVVADEIEYDKPIRESFDLP